MIKRKKNSIPMSAAKQEFSFTRRAMFVGGVQAVFGLALGARMTYIAIVEKEKYTLLSESNRVNLTLIPPRRGWFIDRNGKPIATNRTDFRVDIIPDRVVDKEQTIATLTQLLSLDDDEVTRINRELEQSSGFQPVQIASGLDYEDFALISVRLPDLPGVSPRQGFSRFYPSGAAVGHLIGYVGPVSAEEYQKNRDPLLITPGFKIGKDNLERKFENILQGKPGAKRVEVTASGKIVRELNSREDTPGKPIKLTIDIDLHNYAARRLGLESGSVVVIDCLTGDILTMASMPSFDPNSFSQGIGVSEYAWLREDRTVPLLNKSLQGLYPPGSTLKPLAGLAILEQGISADETIYCNGGYTLGNRRFNCLGRHGNINMADAIKRSCNTYFYTMARRIGYDKIAPVARTLGLGQEFDLPFTSQYYGTIPDSKWLQTKHNRKWTSADSLNAVIGQGYVLASPFQLAVMTARLASGRAILPNIIFNSGKKANSLPFPKESLDVAREGMFRVVNVAGGTATRGQLPLDNVKMAGKTGTSQVTAIRRDGQRSKEWKYRDHGLFVCYAPHDNPRYAAAVVIQHGGGSGAAYPIARDILTFIYDRDKALETLDTLESAWGGTIEQRMAADLARYRQNKAAEENKSTHKGPNSNLDETGNAL